MLTIEKYKGTRFWAVFRDGELLAVTVYKRYYITGGKNRFRGRDCRGSCGKPKRTRLRYCRRNSGQSYQNEKIINSL